MTVLFFIVFPLATILIAVVLQRLLKSPILVAFLVFAIFLILAFTVFTTDFLINAIVYAIIAFITAVIVQIICCLIRRFDLNNCNIFNICGDSNCNSNRDRNGENSSDNNLRRDIAGLRNSIGGLEKSIDSLQDNIDNLTDLLSRILNNNNNGCGCNNSCNRRLSR